MQLKVSSVLALAAAQTGQALMMSRAGTPSMRATAEDSAKRAWLNANEPSWRHRVQSARDAPMTAEAHRGADPSVAMAAQQVKQLRTEEATPSVGPNMMPSLRLDNRPNSRRARLEAKAQNVNVPPPALYPDTGNGPAPQNVLQLTSTLDELRKVRDELVRSISTEEAEKIRIQNAMADLTEQLRFIDECLGPLYATHTEYDRTIRETEAEYAKIERNSESLLQSLSRKSMNLNKQAALPPASTTGVYF